MFKIKKNILLLISLTSLEASESFSILPKVDLAIFFDENDKNYSSLGKIVKQKESLNYSSSVFGGDVGISAKSDDLEFVLQGSGTTSIQNRSKDDEKINAPYFDNDRKDFFYLSNIYLSKQFDDVNLKIGRQKYNNELVNLNKRVTTNQYEGIYLDYKKDLFKINSFYFDKVASSTVANNVPFNHNYGVMGYGKGYKVGEFVSVSEHISNKDYDINGAIVSDITYGDLNNNINIQNLYVDDFFDTFDISSKLNLVYGDFNITPRIGYIKQVDVGENYYSYDYNHKKIDASMYQSSLRFRYKDVFTTFKYASSSSDKDSVLNGTFISPFSNKLGWIIGPQTGHSFIADTISKEFLAGVNFDIFSKKSVFLISSIYYDIGANNGLSNRSLDTREKYIYLNTIVNKNLNLTIQYSIAKNIDIITEDSDNFRAYINYNF
ncbi:MAG: hypothetical protein PHG81_07830 [Aliarcobacter sp.]|nr:hypothetical protein [Aliarcobacter sp.]